MFGFGDGGGDLVWLELGKIGGARKCQLMHMFRQANLAAQVS
jgi:hypothetical protein